MADKSDFWQLKDEQLRNDLLREIYYLNQDVRLARCDLRPLDIGDMVYFRTKARFIVDKWTEIDFSKNLAPWVLRLAEASNGRQEA